MIYKLCTTEVVDREYTLTIDEKRVYSLNASAHACFSRLPTNIVITKGVIDDVIRGIENPVGEYILYSNMPLKFWLIDQINTLVYQQQPEEKDTYVDSQYCEIIYEYENEHLED